MTENTADPVSDFDAFFHVASLWKDDNGAYGSDVVGAGLINHYNTCYMNSALQVLFCTVPLVTKLKNVTCQNHTSGDDSDFCCLKDLKELFNLCMMSANAVQPLKFIKNLSMISPNLQLGFHEDSHEFLLNLLEHIDINCNDGADTDKQSLVREVFGIRSILQDFCFNCHHLSATSDPMFFLTLPVSGVSTLTDALHSYINVEERKGVECGHCNRSSRITQTMIEHAPKVMSFQFNRYDNNMKKDDTAIEYPLELDLRPFIHKSIPDEQTEYELYAVVNHTGCTTDGGHYLCYVRSSSTTWHEKNDEIVCRVTESEVLNKMPYMLFYVKKGTPWFADLDKSQFTFSPKSVLSPSSSSMVEETPQKVDAINDTKIHNSHDSEKYDVHEKEILDSHDSEKYDVHDRGIQDYLESKKFVVHDRESQDSHDSEKYVFHRETPSTSHAYCDFENCVAHNDSSYTSFGLNGLDGNHPKRLNCDSQYPSSTCNDALACQIRPQATKRQKGDDGLAIGVEHVADDGNFEEDNNNKENQQGPHVKEGQKRTADKASGSILRPAKNIPNTSSLIRNILRDRPKNTQMQLPACMSQGSLGIKRSRFSSMSAPVDKRRPASIFDTDPKFDVFSFTDSPNAKQEGTHPYNKSFGCKSISSSSVRRLF